MRITAEVAENADKGRGLAAKMAALQKPTRRNVLGVTDTPDYKASWPLQALGAPISGLTFQRQESGAF